MTVNSEQLVRVIDPRCLYYGHVGSIIKKGKVYSDPFQNIWIESGGYWVEFIDNTISFHLTEWLCKADTKMGARYVRRYLEGRIRLPLCKEHAG